MLEHDVDVLAAVQLTDLLAEATPFGLVLRVLVGPELVSLGAAVDHGLAAHAVEHLGPLGRRDHTDRGAATVQHVLHRVAADATGGAPDEHAVALLHPGAVLADEHAVRRGVAQRVDRRLLPREVGRLRHQLVRLDDAEVGQAAEVRLEPPDPLVGGEHRVVVRRRVLVVDVVAVHGHPVARLPVANGGPDAQHDARGVGTDHVVRQRVALRPLALATQAVEEAERRQRLEDRRPHGVEVDARRHHGEVDLVGSEFRRGHVADVERLARVLVVGGDALEHAPPRRAGRTQPDSARGSAGWRCRHRWRPTGWPRGSGPWRERYRSVIPRPKPRSPPATRARVRFAAFFGASTAGVPFAHGSF